MLDEDGGFTARGGVGGGAVDKSGQNGKKSGKTKILKRGEHIGSGDTFSKITHIAKTKSAKFL